MLAPAAALLLIGTACGPEDTNDAADAVPDVDAPEVPETEPEPEPEPAPEPEPEPEPEPDEPTEPEADDVEPIADDPNTAPKEAEAELGDLGVVAVRLGTHDGFDRITIELEGGGTAGWYVHWRDDATSAGSGEPLDVEGDVFLSVAIRGVTLPPELPEDIELWEGERIEAAEGGVLTELVEDVIFEGTHGFFAGAQTEHPFAVGHLEDPQRVVIDVFHA